jgi:hypothetical protein
MSSLAILAEKFGAVRGAGCGRAKEAPLSNAGQGGCRSTFDLFDGPLKEGDDFSAEGATLSLGALFEPCV